MYKVMTPGPTMVAPNVRAARSLECTNPDLDEAFVEFYKETCELISELLHTRNETLILDGEGILGLEAACASLTEPGDKVLVLDNGIYGKGFADFVTMYGGEPTVLSFDYEREIAAEELEAYLEKNHDFKYATIVHCDTPSGMLNEIGTLCPLLKKYGILTVVDSVSAMFGEPVEVDAFQIDILCGGSQKAVSAPPGLTFVVVSEEAKQAMKTRKTPIRSFYANLAVFDGYYEQKWFPYTMPISDINGLRVAFENIKADDLVYERHSRIAEATRTAIQAAGLALYQQSGFSNTVTVFRIPEGITEQEILTRMKETHNILLAGSFGEFSGKLIRIGHMGYNATEENMVEVMRGLDEVFEWYGIKLQGSLEKEFVSALESSDELLILS